MRSLLPADILVFERGWLSSNNVMLLGRDGCALVDSGYVTHAGQTLQLVSKHLGGRSLQLLANTHLHSDHCGGNAALREAFAGLRILIPPGQARAVEDWDTWALTYAPTGQSCPRFSFDGVLVPGSVVRLGDRDWQVHAAPGHDPHSVILFEPDARVLVSADALWENGFGVVFPELEGERAFEEVAHTLDLIESLRPEVVIPGHGAVFRDVDAALGRARSRLQSYTASPARHAAHAAKVLLKFKLLEVQSFTAPALEDWTEKTPYFSLVWERQFAQQPFRAWVQWLVDELVRSGAAAREGDLVFNA
jgi:glyoxylase-like metal-dependent hydrolase (beta-lactamase superfamily II)